jgi:hypothetical protein
MTTDSAVRVRSLIGGVIVAVVGWTVIWTLIPSGNFWTDTAQIVPLPPAVAAFVTSLRHWGSGNAPFVVREGVGFVVPPNWAFTYFVIGEVLLCGFGATQTISRWTDPVAGRLAPTVFATVMYLVFTAVVALAVAGVLRGRPRIELTRDALVVRDFLSSRTIPWAALRPGQPVTAGPDALTLAFDRPELVVRSGLAWQVRRIPLGYLRVRARLLVDAIQTYVDHPDRRASIGTPAEHERLLGAAIT